ncbi:MAG: hypothetical protein LBR00_07760 [Clostridiales Family XIII bacterium]|jgi:tRNA (guanine-N7-)-methyltransferase|nr:hypothetical protein [Clostridiales Family XIII bacterium]
MRQRRIKDIEEKIAAYRHLLLASEASSSLTDAHPGRWYQRSVGRYALPEGFGRIYVEFGCGRGRFLNERAAGCRPYIADVADAADDGAATDAADAADDGAATHAADAAAIPALFLGVEGCQSVLIKALKKTAAAGLSNVRYIPSFVNDASEAFAPASLDGIYLNFSDPWPKDRHEKRRLTSPRHSAGYFTVLKPGGFLELKTDNAAFFDYSKEKLEEAGFVIAHTDRDHIAAVQTEYERRFVSRGLPIHWLRAEKP